MVRDLQLGDDRQGQEAQRHERRGDRHPHVFEAALHRAQSTIDLRKRSVAHQPGDWQRQLLDEPAAVCNDHPAADLGQAHCARRHVEVIDAEDHDVVRIVRHRGRESAALEAHVSGKAEADPAACMMPLDHCDLDQVSGRIGDEKAIPRAGLDGVRARQELGRDDMDDPNPSRSGRDPKRRFVDRRQADRLPHPVRHIELDESRRPPALEHLPRLERDQVVQDQDVGLVARCDGAQVPEPVIGGGVDGRHDHGVLGADAFRDRHTHHLVDVAMLNDEVRLAVVGAEHAPLGAVPLDKRQQVAQVARDRCLAEHDPHAEAPLLERLVESGRLVVRADAGRDVCVESSTGHAGSVAVDVVGQARAQLRQLRFVTCDDAWKVHHLRDADRAVAAQEALDVARREGPARRLEAGGGHARRGHHEHVEREVRTAVEEPVNAIGAEHVGDLVGVGDHRRGAMTEHGARELVDHEL